MAIPLIISTYCSAGCNHCPFNKAGTKIKNPEINDKEIFNSYEIGQFINLKLVKNLDKDKNIIKSDLFKIS